MATDGAPKASGADDPVLAGALTEMVSEGASLDAPFPSDDQPTSASQPTDGASAASTAAAPTPTGDRGSEPGVAASSTASTDPKPDAGAATAAADPLAGTEPFTYGTGKTLPWAHRVPGEGVLLTEAEVPQLTALAERAETLERAAREISSRESDLTRATTWDVTDSQGKVTSTLTGAAAIEARDVRIARLDAAVSVMDAILSDPAQFARLVAVDDQNQIVVNPEALEYLTKDVLMASQNAESKARSGFTTRAAPPAPSTPAATDHSKSAPFVIDSALKESGFDTKLLTPEDRTYLAEQLSQHVRPVTPEDRILMPQLAVGSPIVDAKFTKVVSHLAGVRRAASAQAKAAEDAGRHNAGMDKGRQPAKALAKPATPVSPAPSTGRTKADWDTPLATALQEMAIER